jgi:hypothetical protein
LVPGAPRVRRPPRGGAECAAGRRPGRDRHRVERPPRRGVAARRIRV